MLYISNAFSVNMIDEMLSQDQFKPFAKAEFHKLDVRDVKEILSKHDFISVVGHQSTADVFSQILGHKIAFNRQSVSLKRRDCIIIGALGTRLPEGKILNEEEIKNLDIKWFGIAILE